MPMHAMAAKIDPFTDVEHPAQGWDAFVSSEIFVWILTFFEINKSLIIP